MSLKLIRSEKNYTSFLSQDNCRHISDGICYGMSASWIFDALEYGGRISNFPDENIELKLAALYHLKSWNNIHDVTIIKRLDILGRQLSWEFKGGVYKIKDAQRQDDCQRELIDYTSQSTHNAACLLIFKTSNELSHAVAVFKDVKSNETFFYDPNVGLYEWSRESMTIYVELKKYLDDKFGFNCEIETVFYFKTPRIKVCGVF